MRGPLLGISCVGITLVLAASAVANEKPRCAGEKVTISYDDRGVGAKITGTEGRDVILGGSENEAIEALGGNDVVCAGDGHDEIDGGPGRDELHGGALKDRLKSSGPAGAAVDKVDGGHGYDRVSFSGSARGVRVNLTTHVMLLDGAKPGQHGQINRVEEVIGTKFADELIGSNDSEDELGDSFYALGGDDYMDGREGGDTLNGGADVDTVSYRSAPTRAVVNLDLHRATVGVGPRADHDRVQLFERVIGSNFDDELVGSKEGEEISGGAGDDEIKGLAGNDTLRGDDGDDTILPGADDDVAIGGANDPVTSFGEHGDMVSFLDATLQPDDDPGTYPHVDASLSPDRFGNPPGATGEEIDVGKDVFDGVESLRGPVKIEAVFSGDDGPNVLFGSNHGDDALTGFGGNDFLFGLGGPDALFGGTGDDFLDGGSATDVVNPEESGSDLMDGQEGFDTCVDAQPDFVVDCEAGDAVA